MPEGQQDLSAQPDEVRSSFAVRLDETKRRIALYKELPPRGWIEGETYDYEVDENGWTQVRAKNGVLANSLLPDKASIRYYPEKAHYFNIGRLLKLDVVKQANEVNGLNILAHEAGHAQQHSLNPEEFDEEGKKSQTLNSIDSDEAF